MGVSDHSLICGCRKISFCKTSPKIVETRNFKHYKTLEFKRDLSIALSNCDWSTDDPNTLWKQFKDRFNEVSNLHAPIRLKKVKSKYTPWMNGEIIKLMNYRDTLKKKAVKTKSSRFHEAYKTARNDVNRLIKNTKASYFQEVISNSKNNSKEMWRNINKLIGKTSRTTNVTSVKSNDQIFTNKDDIAETFNDYFSKIGTELSNRIPPSSKGFEEYLERSVSAVFEFKSVSNDEVETVLSKLKVSKSSGQDKIPVKILKDSSDICVSYLTYIYNCSLLSGIFPDWKLAKVSPIYKSGNKQECGNYRNLVPRAFPFLSLGSREKALAPGGHMTFNTQI